MEADKMRKLRLFAIAALTVVYAHAGLDEQPRSPDENPDRFVIDNGALAISRPHETWKVEVEASDPPTMAEMRSPDGAAVADISVQQIPGVTLSQVKEPIEQALAAQGQDFSKLSTRDIEVHGVAAYELTFTLTWEGEPHKAKMLVVKPGDTLYIVKCRSSAEAWPRFEGEFDKVLAGVERLSREPWGRRIEWEAEAGPEAREHASFMLDPSRDRAVMLLGSGYQPYLDPLGDAWAYDLKSCLKSSSRKGVQVRALTPAPSLFNHLGGVRGGTAEDRLLFGSKAALPGDLFAGRLYPFRQVVTILGFDPPLGFSARHFDEHFQLLHVPLILQCLARAIDALVERNQALIARCHELVRVSVVVVPDLEVADPRYRYGDLVLADLVGNKLLRQ
jgi:hypothetical protein